MIFCQVKRKQRESEREYYESNDQRGVSGASLHGFPLGSLLCKMPVFIAIV